MKKIFSLLLAALLISSCLPQDMQVPQSPLLPLLERKSGLIAYIGVDWNIYTSDQAGKNITAYTNDALIPAKATDPFHYYSYPTWSPDGASIGFIGVSGQGTKTSANMYIATIDEDSAKKVFSSESEHPFYLYWSPDNINLGFLSTTADGQSMILQSVSSEGKDRTLIDTGAPYYWSWAPDGQTMIVHAGSAENSAPEHLAFLKVDSAVTEDGLDLPLASFQAPAWSPDGQRILLTRVNEQNKKEIILTNGRGEFEKAIGSFDLNAAFAWSNNSDRVAYIEGKQTLGAGTLGRLHVIDLETEEDLFNDENVFSFFWSPNDEKIAYFVPMLSATDSESQSDSTTQAEQQLLLQLKILDLKSDESRELFTFNPTEQFAAIMPYFDQYHQSATIWSPDNNNLVISFMATDGTPGIAIVAASGEMEPRLLTQGYLAFWSWR